MLPSFGTPLGKSTYVQKSLVTARPCIKKASPFSEVVLLPWFCAAMPLALGGPAARGGPASWAACRRPLQSTELARSLPSTARRGAPPSSSPLAMPMLRYALKCSQSCARKVQSHGKLKNCLASRKIPSATSCQLTLWAITITIILQLVQVSSVFHSPWGLMASRNGWRALCRHL